MNRAERRRQAKLTNKRAAPRDPAREVIALMDAGEIEAAMTVAEQAAERAPKAADARALAGAVLLQGGAADRAIPHLEAVTAADPRNAEALTNLGVALATCGRATDAERALRAAVASAESPFPFALYNLAQVLRDHGDKDEAIGLLRQALAIHPFYLKAMLALGSMLLDRGETDAAAEVIARAVEADPEAPEVHFARGDLARELGDFSAAAAAFRAGLKIVPDDPAALVSLADCLLELGQIDQALERYRQALVLAPKAYAAVVKHLTSASKGVLELDPRKLRRLLTTS